MANNANELLVEFESLIDLDLAIYKYIRSNYGTSPLVNKEFIREQDERAIIFKLLNRPHINPLEIIIPGENTTDLYYSLLNEHYEDILKYATATDLFGLMITFLNNAHSIGITILCKSELESNFIKSMNDALDTIVIPKRSDVPLNKYTVLYVKYISYLAEYNKPVGKHIYIHAAKYNMQEDKDMVSHLSCLFGDVNEIHLIDPYVNIKYRFPKKKGDENNEDLL